MLYILVGPSGAGKSSIMAQLHNLLGWKVVPTYTTRPARPNDLGRISVTVAEFIQLDKARHLYTTKSIFGQMYGEDRSAVDRALLDEHENWCLDIAFGQHHRFASTYSRTAIVLPNSQNQLRRQLQAAGRDDRIDSALQELQACEDFVETLPNGGTIRAFRNGPGQIESVVELMRGWAAES